MSLKDPSYERSYLYQALKHLQVLRPLYYKILLRR